MSWLLTISITFALVALAEFGDKTQLMTVCLASKYRAIPVFWGVFLGMSLVTIIGVVLGTLLYAFIPIDLVKILAGSIFIIFGIYTYTSEDKEDQIMLEDKHVFRNSFTLSAIAEFGDKTQFAVIALTARYATPIPVLIGALTGLALVVGLGTIFGDKISLYVSKENIEFGSVILFLVIGVFFILEVFI